MIHTFTRIIGFPIVVLIALLPEIGFAGSPQPNLSSPELHRAIQQGDVDTWTRLLKTGTDITIRDPDGNTPLHLAALNGNRKLVSVLLDRGAEVDAQNEANATPLIYGVTNREVVATLLNHGANPNSKTNHGRSPLLSAVNRGQSYEVVKLLIDAGADPNVHGSGSPWDGGALYLAIQSGDPRTIDLLLDKGASLEPIGSSFSVLDVAAMVGDLKTAKRLLKAGVDPNYSSRGYGDSPGHALNWALWAENHEIAEELITHGADLHFAPQVGGETPPMVWAGIGQAGDPKIARMLIERGLDVNTVNAIGESALHYALKSGENTELARYLLDAGAKKAPASSKDKSMPNRQIPRSGLERAAMVRRSAQKAIKLMQHSSEAFLNRQNSCVSCHHQLLPPLAYEMGQLRGLVVDEVALGHQLVKQLGDRRKVLQERARELDTRGFGGPRPLIALAALGFAPDEGTLAAVRLLREIQTHNGSIWNSFGRFPMDEPGPHQGTAWSIRALQLYPLPDHKTKSLEVIQRAVEVIRNTRPNTLNQRASQVLGLSWGNAEFNILKKAVEELLSEQRPDGGWAQLSTLKESDAWATGKALYAIYESGIVSPTNERFQRGVKFLLRTQFEDGSWWVRSRVWPFQPHFDSQFPHGKDQWISIGGTTWATMALLTTLEPTRSRADLKTGKELIELWKRTQDSNAMQPGKQTVKSLDTKKILFTRDIQPIFKRSCLSCHSGERAKGGFKLDTRPAILKGGQSQIPAIKSGSSEQSPLIRFVSDEVEDLEMPPLSKREEYPALTHEEVELLAEWIEEGALWSEDR